MSARSFALLATALFALACWIAASVGVDDDDVAEAQASAAPASHAGATATPRGAPAARVAPTSRAVASAAAEPAAAPPRRSSLAGTDIDGAFDVGDDGRFVADRQAIRLFDYFLSTSGERDDSAIADAIARVAHARLSPDDADRAMALYRRYRRYREALAAAMAGGEVVPGDARATLALVRRVQIDSFGVADAEQLFGRDDALAAQLLDRAGSR